MSSQSPQDPSALAAALAAAQDGTAAAATNANTTNTNNAADWGSAKEAADNLTQQAIVADLERGYLSIQTERDDLQSQVDKVKAELHNATHAMVFQQDLERQATNSQHQLSLQQQRVKALDEEKKTAEERMDRMQAEADNLRGEIRYVMLCMRVLMMMYR
jgi:chromosome segregation ATPase